MVMVQTALHSALFMINSLLVLLIISPAGLVWQDLNNKYAGETNYETSDNSKIIL